MSNTNWNVVFDILVQECGANERDRENFILKDGDFTEYRFIGSLGFGGKIRNDGTRLRVSYYTEDATPVRPGRLPSLPGQPVVLFVRCCCGLAPNYPLVGQVMIKRSWINAHVEYKPSGTVHAVDAGGSAADGSLYGFSTLCGRTIEDIDRWNEDPDIRITCQACLRAQIAAIVRVMSCDQVKLLWSGLYGKR